MGHIHPTRESKYVRGLWLYRPWRLSLFLLVLSVVIPPDILFMTFRSQPKAWSAEPRSSTDPRAQIRRLFESLHSQDPRQVADSRAALERLGFSNELISVGAEVVAPDRSVRLKLARSLPRQSPAIQNAIAADLAKDRDEDVRAATLQSLQDMKPLPHLRPLIVEMSESDASPLVRGYARLLQADWGSANVVPLPVEAPVSPVQRVEFARPADGRLPGQQTGMAVVGRRPVIQSLFRPQYPHWSERAAENSNELDEAPFETVSSQAATQDLPPAPGGTTVPISGDEIRPNLLRPFDDLKPGGSDDEPEGRRPNDYLTLLQGTGPLIEWDTGAPLGFAGHSGVKPSESQENSHFVPVEDRWRSGFPAWDRYDKGHPSVDDYPYVEGHWWDPYNQNVLKGDYPIIGQHTFLKLTGISQMLHEFREVPTPTTPFESTARPGQERFFGDPFQYFYNHNFKLQIDLFHGSAAFKPFDWQARVTPVFNMNYLDVNELGVVNPDVRRGTHRWRTDVTLEEWFIEAKLGDLSPNYDFVSVRAGSQLFNSDFRGFIFSDINRAVRLFGTRFSNRDQFNLIWFDQTEKETNSLLNTFEDRHQNTFIANYYREDFVVPGYTAQASFHYNRDGPSFKFDRNNFLVRPDPAGVFQEHQVEAYYFGVTGNGHFGRLNISNAFYWVIGTDSLNPIASRPVDINAQMAAVELSYDRDWVRFRTSFMWASGDDNPNDDVAEGFDSIFDNPNFAGGEFSYWQRQAVRLFGVNLVQRQSLVPDLSSSKFQGQSNFVNPGLWLVNAGMDFELTPKLRAITNANFLWFDSTRTLETFTFQDRIEPEIGTDISLGFEYRPFLNDNVQIIGGTAWLLPGDGFDDLFGKSDFTLGNVSKVDAPNMFSHFLELILIF